MEIKYYFNKFIDFLERGRNNTNLPLYLWCYLLVAPLFMIDALFLTPYNLKYLNKIEINPIHAFGFNYFGIQYSFILFVFGSLIIISIFYLVKKYSRKYTPEKACYSIVFSIIILEIMGVVNNTINIIMSLR